MKFLKFFNTRVDSDELAEAIKHHWEWNVILVKYHWIKLLSPFLCAMLSLCILAVILYIIDVNLIKWYETIFWCVSIFYILTTLSWTWYAVWLIFKTILAQINDRNKYIEKVDVIVARKWWFEVFLRWSTGVLIFHLLFLIFNASVPFIFDFTWRGNFGAPIVVLLLDMLFLINVTMVMYWIIDYEMNFGICSPHSFKLFKQTGILSSDVSDITPQSINIIKYHRKWLLQSIFQFWKISLYTDAEVRTQWWNVIELYYIPDPANIVKKLNKILGKAG